MNLDDKQERAKRMIDIMFFKSILCKMKAIKSIDEWKFNVVLGSSDFLRFIFTRNSSTAK